MKKTFLKSVLLFTLLIAAGFVKVQAQNTQVAVEGDVARPFKINAATFAAMKRTTVKAMAHDKKEHEYSGVSLYDILTKAEAVSNNQLKGKLLAKYVLITAADNYQVVIALPEFDPAFSEQTIILANKEDGKSLAANVGPYQLIVPKDKKPARCVRQVTSINVQTAKNH